MSNHWLNRTYATIPYPPAPEVWIVVIESLETCRRSVDGSLVLVKWEGTVPPILSGSTVYNHTDILAILATPAWRPEEAP